MRLVPEAAQSSTFTHLRSAGAPSAPGLHDTLRHGVGPSSHAPTTTANNTSTSEAPASAHPLEARLKAWEATQESLRMESLRRAFGIAEPVRRGMELKIVSQGEWRPQALRAGGGGAGLPGVHEEILRGREAVIEWEDVYTGEEQRVVVPVVDEMERKLKI